MQKERMLAGKLYTCITEEKQLADMRVRKNRFLDRFNGTAFEDFDTRRRLVEEIFEKNGQKLRGKQALLLRLRLQHKRRGQFLRQLRPALFWT